MPISRKEWETGKIEDESLVKVRTTIREFLTEHPEAAYTKMELRDEIKGRSKILGLDSLTRDHLESLVEEALKNLEEDGTIKEKIIKALEYYIFVEP